MPDRSGATPNYDFRRPYGAPPSAPSSVYQAPLGPASPRDDFSPEPGATILAGDKPVGTMGSTSGKNGLALIRTDRVTDALDAGLKLTAGGLAIHLAEPDELRPPPKQTVA